MRGQGDGRDRTARRALALELQFTKTGNSRGSEIRSLSAGQFHTLVSCLQHSLDRRAPYYVVQEPENSIIRHALYTKNLYAPHTRWPKMPMLPSPTAVPSTSIADPDDVSSASP